MTYHTEKKPANQGKELHVLPTLSYITVMKRFLSASPLAFWAFMTFSCNVNADLSISEKGGKVAAVVDIKAPTLSYWKDLRDLDPNLPVSPLDKQTFQKTLSEKAASSKGLIKDPLVKDEKTGMALSFEVQDWDKLQTSLLDMNSESFITQESITGGTRLTLTLNRKTIRHLAALTSYGHSQALTTLIPEEKSSVTQKEYRDLLIYLLEPYTDKANLLIDSSTVELKLHFPRIVKQSSGTQEVKGNTAVCRWPLARILSLQTPVVVTVDY